MKTLYKLLLIAAGNFLVAFSVVFFILPEDILSGGTATVAIVLAHYTPVSRVAWITILNFALFGVGWLTLGSRFALSALLSTLIYPMFVSVLSAFDVSAFAQLDPLLASFYGGGLAGIGLGLVFRVNGSTGGMDIPALMMHKYLAMPQSTAVMIVDALTIGAGLYVFGIESILIGMIAVFATTFAINWTQTLGAQPAKKVMIISEKWPAVQKYLLEDVSRGVTILDGRGAWSGQDRPVLMCVVSNREYSRVEAGIAAIDSRAFIIIDDVHEVRGSGFTYKDGTY